MSADTAKNNSHLLTEDLVTSVFNELSSAGFLEQLRLECVTNVKTMSTYLQLKKRFVELLNKKLSNADWKFEMSAPRLSILREQIVECSVLAVTIERVVDEVVSWQLRDRIVPLIKEILCACYDPKEVSKLKLNHLSGSNPSFAQLKQVIKKICDHIHVDWKHVFKDEVIGKSLASISFSTSMSQQSDDEVSSNDESESDSDVEIILSDQEKKKLNKRKIESIIVEEDEENHPKRERKKNSKYFSDIYQTPNCVPISEPFITSTPESIKLSDSHIKGYSENNNSSKKQLKLEKIVSPIKISQLKSNKSSPKITNSTIKIEKDSETKKSQCSFSSPTSSNKSVCVTNGFVRKSERQPKPNSRLFWEPGESPHKTRIERAEQEADDDLKQMELSILKSELQRNGDVCNDKIYKDPNVKKKLLTDSPKTQKFEEKPIPVLTVRKRGRPRKEIAP